MKKPRSPKITDEGRLARIENESMRNRLDDLEGRDFHRHLRWAKKVMSKTKDQAFLEHCICKLSIGRDVLPDDFPEKSLQLSDELRSYPVDLEGRVNLTDSAISSLAEMLAGLVTERKRISVLVRGEKP